MKNDYVGNKEFVVFITCYGKPNDIPTIQTLKNVGYTGDWYLVCSDDDKTLIEYEKNYPDKVIVFNKLANKNFDIMDNFNQNKCVVFARNACFDFAKNLGYKYFLEIDDDICYIFGRQKRGNGLYRWNLNLRQRYFMDDLFNAYIDYLNCSNALQCVCLPQGGDFIGGLGSNMVKRGFLRKCMNSQICKVEDRFEFKGRINEDVNAVLEASKHGKVHMQLFDAESGGVVVDQRVTQTTGGLTEIYLSLGTYVKSFYSVMLMPSSVVVDMMGDTHVRMHHKVIDNLTHPKILSSKYKK